MKRFAVLFLLVLITLFFLTPGYAEVREWTRASDGKKITAEFAGMKNETTVKIKLGNGQIYEVPLSGLSPEDGVFIQDAVAKESVAMKATVDSGVNPPQPRTEPEGPVTVILSGVHLCCRDCEEAVTNIAANEKTPVPAGVVITPNRKEGSISVAAASGKDAQAALRSILAAGFFGSSDHDVLKIADLKPDEFTTNTMIVRDAHLCCAGCVKAFARAVASVKGVKSHEAKSGATSVKIEGEDFKPYEVMQTLREAGFGGTFQ